MELGTLVQGDTGEFDFSLQGGLFGQEIFCKTTSICIIYWLCRSISFTIVLNQTEPNTELKFQKNPNQTKQKKFGDFIIHEVINNRVMDLTNMDTHGGVPMALEISIFVVCQPEENTWMHWKYQMKLLMLLFMKMNGASCESIRKQKFVDGDNRCREAYLKLNI